MRNCSLGGFPVLLLSDLLLHNTMHCQWSSDGWMLGFYYAQRFACPTSITNFKGEARVSRMKRIMIITLSQGTATSWKWMGSSLWELWQGGSSCLSEGHRRSKVCLACGHPVYSCVLIKRNQFGINDQLYLNNDIQTKRSLVLGPHKPWDNTNKYWQMEQPKLEYNRGIQCFFHTWRNSKSVTVQIPDRSHWYFFWCLNNYC